MWIGLICISTWSILLVLCMLLFSTFQGIYGTRRIWSLPGSFQGPVSQVYTWTHFWTLLLNCGKAWRWQQQMVIRPYMLQFCVLHVSDVYATRKLGRFVGHGSLKGCSRYLKPIPTTEFGTKHDYSGFQLTRSSKGMNWKHANTLKKDKTLNITMVSNCFTYLTLTPFNLQLWTMLLEVPNTLWCCGRELK